MSVSHRTASALWIVLLPAASILATLALACATPFTALAAIGATRLRPRDGVLATVVAWLASQAVGFCVLGYPADPRTLLWGVLGTAAVGSVLAAQGADARIGQANPTVRVALAYLAAAIAFKLVILLWSLGLGGVATALSPAINARQFVRNGAILAGLLLLYRGLVAIGLPATPPRRMAVA